MVQGRLVASLRETEAALVVELLKSKEHKWDSVAMQVWGS